MTASVAVVRCDDYADADFSVRQCLESIGGLGSIVRAGTRTLLKVNLVSAHEESRAVTTHPAIIAAVIKEVRKLGGLPCVGDSPALLSAEAVARKSGIARVCQTLGVPIINLDDPTTVMNPRAKRVRAFQLSRKLDEFDAIINIPKLKTHCLVGMTGAVKNMFGCIPGKLKTAQHLLHQSPLAFSEMLLDLYDTCPPQFSVVDAVIAMEGPGPGSGYPRKLGLVIAGNNALAVDAVCAKILGFTDNEVLLLELAKKRGLREASVEHIRICGERICDVAPGDVIKPRASATTHVPGFVMALGRRHLTARPVMVPSKCTRCLDCMRICAANAISIGPRVPLVDERKCIRCYCCQEVCPSHAVELKKGFLSGLFGA
jgi:uncharacterized protein (DUF362 family)/Pyruvate/2-oxoacid:ferredoxin oxidoreductase delta subunit